MENFLRGVLGVFAGCLVAVAAMSTCETMGHVVFPPPVGIDPSKPGAMAAYVRGMRPVEFLPVLFGWAAGTLIGSSVAAKLAAGRKVVAGLVVGFLLMASSVANMLMIPHPIWVWAAGLAIFPAFSAVGSTLGSLGAADRPAYVEDRP